MIVIGSGTDWAPAVAVIVIVVVVLLGLGVPVQPPTNVAIVSRNRKAAAMRRGIRAVILRLRQKAERNSSSAPKIGANGERNGSERPGESPLIFGVVDTGEFPRRILFVASSLIVSVVVTGAPFGVTELG